MALQKNAQPEHDDVEDSGEAERLIPVYKTALGCAQSLIKAAFLNQGFDDRVEVFFSVQGL
jgi:hypothetical protein